MASEPSKGWAKPEGSGQWHYFDKGVSLCKHWMAFWFDPDHPLDDPENCPDCVQFVRAGNTTLVNPFA
jgi:hypothetical protein